MNFRYSPIKRVVKKIYRKFIPVPISPYTAGHVANICAVNLVPAEKLISFFQDYISKLQKIKGEDIGDYLEFGIFNGNSIGSMYLAKNNMGGGKTHATFWF